MLRCSYVVQIMLFDRGAAKKNDLQTIVQSEPATAW